MRNVFAAVCLMAFAVLGLSSCDKDGKGDEPKLSNIELAKAHLNGEVVLSTTALMNGFNLTRLPEGCPVKYKLAWDKDELIVKIVDFRFGSMPIPVNFGCRTKLVDVTADDKDAPKGDGWMKISGTDGCFAMPGTEIGDYRKNSGATVKGYYNAKSREIELNIDFGLGKDFPIIAKCDRQVVDKNRLKNYDAEMKEFEKKIQRGQGEGKTTRWEIINPRVEMGVGGRCVY